MKKLVMTEVIPGKLYLHRRPGESKYEPVRIQCDEKSQGWLRGHVSVRGFGVFATRYSAVITLEPFFGGQNLDTHVYRDRLSDPWYFYNDGYEKLVEVNDDEVRKMIDARVSKANLGIKSARATITACELEIERLKQLKV
jgi:hypothetical protein